jgi:YHS domain-containing protein
MWYILKQAALAGVVIGIAGGCAANHSAPVSASSKGTVVCAAKPECLVCKKNADLACVDVDVDSKTPFLDFSGKRYYFCSDECRLEFQKNPAKYVNAK